MGLFDDLSRFLESRLDEFLKAHPELELQALDDQLNQQEADARRLLDQSRSEERRIQSRILTLAQEIKTWHLRVEKAAQANRPDLAERAKQREAALLNQGNQLWGQMQGTKERIQQMESLLVRVQKRRQEVKDKIQSLKAQQRATSQAETSWGKPVDPYDELEQEFQKLEVDVELQKMRRNKR